MASYVVDASIVVEYLITGSHTPHAQAFFNRVTAADRLVVPEFCVLECTNVLWKQVRFSSMSRSEAQDLVRVLRMLKLRRAPMKRLLDRALDIGLDHALSVYDSGYIALALHYDYPLVTLDQRQGEAATAAGVTLLQLAHFT